MNFPLFSMIWSMAATVAMGVFMVIALVLNYDGIPHIIGAVIAGALLALPIALVLTKKIGKIGSTD